MTIANQLDLLTKKAKEMQEKLKKELQETFNKALKEFFEKYPDNGITFIWTQYTPYFNDGEPCEFRVYSPEVRIKSNEGEEVYDDSYSYGDNDQTKQLPSDLQEDVKAIWSFIKAQEDLMLQLYGDHCEIRLNKDGAEINNCDHE